MPVCCDYCGNKISKYCVVKYEVEYLEQYLADYFQRDIYELNVKYIRRSTDRMFRAICFHVLKEFGGLALYEIGRRYGTSIHTIRDSMKQVDKADHDYKFIFKDLRNELPEVIKYLD